MKDRLPEPHCPPLLVTNNINGRNAFGHMSHVWRVQMLHKQSDGSFCAFDDRDCKVHGITHWAAINPPAPGALADRLSRIDAKERAVVS